MPDSRIFCNIPWYEIHVNHDGSYDLCGCMSELITQTPMGEHWNIKNYSVDEYWNSRRLRDERLSKMSDTANPACEICHYQDSIGNHSKRIKENFKSVLFPDHNFDRSFEQSPHKHIFEYSANNDGETTTRPVSYHLSLGNECDLACVMCSPNSSYKLARDYEALGWISQAKRLNWTDDPVVWQKFTDTVVNTNNLVSFHIIGGEPTINKRFHELIDKFVDSGNTNFSFSFTTNGMHRIDNLWTKLEKFRRVEIGISIETVTESNNYIRYGSDIARVIENIQSMKQTASANVDFVIRTVPTLLTITEYDQVIRWCWQNNMLLNSYFALDPVWQQIHILPESIKAELRPRFENLLKELEAQPRTQGLTNYRNPTRVLENCLAETAASLMSLMPTEPVPATETVSRLKQLDQLRGTDVRQVFPILKDWLDSNDY